MINNLEVKTNLTEEIIDITKDIITYIKQENLQNGILFVFNPHTTAGLTINENADPDVKEDILKGFNSLDFEKLPFKHFEGNSAAHIKSIITGNSIQLFVHNSELILGNWQGVYFCEFDGPRSRKLKLKFIAG